MRPARRRRIYVECTYTYLAGGTDGMRRVVRNLVRFGAGDGAEARPLVWGGFHFFVPRAPLTERRHPLMRVADAYARVVGVLERLLAHLPRSVRRPFASARAFLMRLMRRVPRRSKGRVVYALLGLISWLAVPFGVRPVALGRGDVIVLADSTWNDPELLTSLRRAQARGAVVGVMIHDLFPLTLPDMCQPITVAAFTRWFPHAAQVADFYITNSEATRAALARHLGDGAMPPSASFQLGSDLEPVDPGVEPALPRGLAGFVILCVGTLEPRKNHAVLLDAFDLLAARDPDATLLLIGRVGWGVQGLQERIEGHPLLGERLFHLVGASDATLRAAYARADALVCPSWDEGFGLPLMEGLAAGVPAIASDIPVFHEVAGDACVTFPPDDPAALADRLSALRAGDHPWARATDRPPVAMPPIPWSSSGRRFVEQIRALVKEVQRERRGGPVETPTPTKG